MIGIIADDLSGAAEMAGVTFRYGLEAVVCLQPDSGNLICDALILDTDSRSLSEMEAAARLRKAGSELQKKNPDWIYKKVDSVFRGNIAIELETLSSIWKFKRTLLIPANPSLGRTIRHGHYYIHDQLLENTDFAADPELASKTSSVVKLLNSIRARASVSAKPGYPLAEGKIVIGDAHSIDELIEWAEELQDDILAAGGSDFLAAILENRDFQPTTGSLSKKYKWPRQTLLISGTASQTGRERIDQAEREGIPICRMPEELLEQKSNSDKFLEKWQKQISTCLRKRKLVIAAIGLPRSNDPRAPLRIIDHLLELTKRLLHEQKLEHLLIEGGATASSIIRGHNWNFLKTLQEWDRGVVSLTTGKKDEPILTIKPGSYPWPKEVCKGQ